MDSFITLLKAQSVIIVYILIGVLLSKKGMITYKSRGAFTDFVIKVTLPCMVFSSFMGEMTGDMKYFDDAANQVLQYNKYLWCPEKQI